MIDAGAVRCPICGGRKQPRKDAPRSCRRCRGKGYVMVERRVEVADDAPPGPTGTTWIDWGSDTTGPTWWNSAVATTGRAC